MEIKQYMILNHIGIPIMRKGDEANPYIFYSLRDVFKFIEEELKHQAKGHVIQKVFSVVEIKIIEKINI